MFHLTIEPLHVSREFACTLDRDGFASPAAQFFHPGPIGEAYTDAVARFGLDPNTSLDVHGDKLTGPVQLAPCAVAFVYALRRAARTGDDQGETAHETRRLADVVAGVVGPRSTHRLAGAFIAATLAVLDAPHVPNVRTWANACADAGQFADGAGLADVARYCAALARGLRGVGPTAGDRGGAGVPWRIGHALGDYLATFTEGVSRD